MSVLQLKNCNLHTQPDLSRSQVNRLSFAGNLITVFFSEYLPQNLQHLDLGNNYLADDGIPFLLPDSIQELLLDSNNICSFDGKVTVVIFPFEGTRIPLYIPVQL